MLTFKVVACTSREGARKAARHLLGPTIPLDLAKDLAITSGRPVPLRHQSAMRLGEGCDPRLVNILEINGSIIGEDQVTNLFMGRTAGGRAIAGLRQPSVQASLAEAARLPADVLPTFAHLAELAAGRLGDGTPGHAASLADRVFACYGTCAGAAPSDVELRSMALGLAPDGSPIGHSRLLRRLNHHVGPLAALSLCWSAPKSLSVAWGLTGGAERALLEQAHLEGVQKAMEAVRDLLGHARRGDGGYRIHAATCCFIATTHYTSRPVTDADGVWPGDAQLHDHAVLPAVVRAEDGRLGKPDFGRLRSAVKTLGATYQAETAAALRRCGVGVSIDPEQAAFKLDAIPQAACDAFSKRTTAGWRAARIHSGPGFDGLRRTQRVGLLKVAIQGNPRAARRDDIAQPKAWQAEAAPFLPNGLHVVDPDRPSPTMSRGDRLAIAIGVAGERLVSAEANGERMLARTAATIGLIAAGLEDRAEVGEVAAALGHVDALADALDAVGRKRIDGTALLVKGDADITIAAMWIEQNTAYPAPDPVQVATPTEARRYNAAIRSACKDQGLIGPDLVSVTIGDPDDRRTIGLARGDRITLLAPVNGRSNGGRRGRVASAGGTATVVDIDDDGIVNGGLNPGQRSGVKPGQWIGHADMERAPIGALSMSARIFDQAAVISPVSGSMLSAVAWFCSALTDARRRPTDCLRR